MERGFRLAGLLRLRALQEEQAAAVLAVSNAALQAAEQHRHATLDRLAGHALPTSAEARAWRASAAARSTFFHLLAEAGADVREAGERVSADTTVWSAARSRSVGLEKLQEKHVTLVHAEDARVEQLALDEVASRSARGPRALTPTEERTSA